MTLEERIVDIEKEAAWVERQAQLFRASMAGDGSERDARLSARVDELLAKRGRLMRKADELRFRLEVRELKRQARAQ